VYVYLTDRDFAQTNGQLLVATYSYMGGRGGVQKMVEKAKKKLTCTRDEYTPPNGWTQEPDAFNGLKLDMPKAEAEKRVSFGNCTVTTTEIPDFPTRENFLYETTLNVGGLAIPGEVLFIENRLINLGGKFDRSLWDVIKTAFIDLYGRPHVDERNEIFEQGLSRRLEWQGDRVRIGLLDFPDGTDLARFSGIGELVSAFKEVTQGGGQLKVMGLGGQGAYQLLVTKSCTFFKVYVDEATAIRSFG
jgi:hypothetical protein